MINPSNPLGNPVVHTRTFSNDGAGALTLFTVTGDIIIRMIPVCDTNVVSAAAADIELGVIGDTDAMLASTLATDLDAREIWIDAAPDSEIEPLDAMREYIVTDGNNVILTLDAQVDSGVIVFYAWWIPMSTNANLVAN